MRPVILPQPSVTFRTRLIDALLRIDRERFWYIDADTCAGACPVCDGILSVYFHGTAARADLECHGGCTEREVSNALDNGSSSSRRAA